MSDSKRPLLLYVEDEIFTQHLVESTLQDAGYEVWTASDGTEALERLASAGPTFRGLVTDVDLGDCPNGWQVAREARTFLPELPVVYVSGASAHDWSAMGVPDSLIVPKPFSPGQIVAAMAFLFAKAAR
ncbi:response regulator [soil metagenome]